MKYMQLRSNMFETNSSSMHSISIGPDCKEDMMDSSSLRPDSSGTIELRGGEFGWSEEKFTDAYTKANYLAVWVKVYSNQKEKDRKLLNAVLKKQTGAKKIEWAFSTDWKGRNLSYIDHQSDNVAAELFDCKMAWAREGSGEYKNVSVKGKTTRTKVAEKIRQFVFNPKSVLVTDNDNH